MNDVHAGQTGFVPVFRHAVASFEPTSTTVILWTRLTGAIEATWTVATDPDLTDVVATGSVSADPLRDHTVRVDVEDLTPRTTYWYRFEAAGERSPVGRTRTLPSPDDVAPVRVGVVCCGRYSYAPLTVYRALAEVDVDLVVHLGDYIYEDDGSQGPREHVPPHTAVTLDDYRARIAQVREDADAQSLHIRHPMVAVWDDHDLADNAWSHGAKAHEPGEHGPWDDRVGAAAQARDEWLPGRNSDPLVTWRAVDLGGAGELLLLDTRIAGRDQHAGDEGTSDLHDQARSMLGDEQRAWLRDRLGDTSKPWSIVASSVVVSPLVLPIPEAFGYVNAALPNGYAALDGVVMHDDQWDGYPAERDQLIENIAARADAGGRTLILSGDVHASWAFDGPLDRDDRPVAIEATCPSASSAPFARSRWPGLRHVIHAAVKRLPHVRWCDLTERGFVVVEVSGEGATSEWWFADADDPAERPAATRGATFRSAVAEWPARWHPAPALALSRTAPHEAPRLPPRPSDIADIRRTRVTLRTIAAGVAAALAVGAATVAALWSPSGGRGPRSRGRLTARR